MMAQQGAFGLRFKDMQKRFFTKPYVREKLDRIQYNYLLYQGMNIRKDARRNAKPLGPDSAKGKGLALIYYAFDRQTHSVVVGPILFDSQSWNEMTVPESFEYGGYVTPKPGYEWPARHQEAHPFMQPALEKNLTEHRQEKVWKAARRKAGA